jgi:SAM-dependent methyltransferase
MVTNEPVWRAALSEVSMRTVELLELDPTTCSGPDESMYRVTAALAMLLASIAAAERAGVPEHMLDAALAPAHAELGRAPFYQRTHTWPRGYAGDFETVEMLCYPQRFGTEKRSLAEWAHEITLASPSVQQHRNKIVKQALVVLDKAIGATADTRILSAACGGCPDLRLILPLLRGFPGRFVLVDSDEHALAFSRGQLGALASSCDFVHLNVLRYLKRAAMEGSSFDLVYAGGLFDYFDDRTLAFFVATAHRLLKPGGRLFFTNLAEGNLHLMLIRHFARWRLILRSEAAVLEICRGAGIDPNLIQIERDATGVTLLVDVQKP